MKINLSQAGKRFNREWIFRNATLDFEQGISYAITGPNGSGKSTLLQCIAGMMQLSEGGIEYAIGNKRLVIDKVFAAISFCAPSLDLIEELTLTEFLNFHFRFKKAANHFSSNDIISYTGLEHARKKTFRYF